MAIGILPCQSLGIPQIPHDPNPFSRGFQSWPFSACAYRVWPFPTLETRVDVRPWGWRGDASGSYADDHFLVDI